MAELGLPDGQVAPQAPEEEEAEGEEATNAPTQAALGGITARWQSERA